MHHKFYQNKIHIADLSGSPREYLWSGRFTQPRTHSLTSPARTGGRRACSRSLWLLKCGSDDSVTKWLRGSKIVSQNPITALHEFCPLHMCPQPSEFFNLKIKAEKYTLILSQTLTRLT